jgi:hypothetical protein
MRHWTINDCVADLAGLGSRAGELPDQTLKSLPKSNPLENV